MPRPAGSVERLASGKLNRCMWWAASTQIWRRTCCSFGWLRTAAASSPHPISPTTLPALLPVSGSQHTRACCAQLNTLAGRTYSDMAQYPVFPWVVADYASASLDLNDPATFRDLAKPVGALDEKRLQFFLERFESLRVRPALQCERGF